MPTYNTTSEFSDLVGSMVVTDNNVDSYTSDTQGTGIVTNLGGKDTLEFSVSFTKDGRTYHIDATPSNGGNEYEGEANDGTAAGGEEPWGATVETEETATKTAAY